MTPKYRFNADQHLHELYVNGEWQPLVGTSSAMSVVAKPLTWWSSGLAVQAFGCPDAKLLTKIKNGKATEKETEQLGYAAAKWLDDNHFMQSRELIALWDKAYRAHATTLKEKAVEGVDLHAELERFIRDQIDGNQTPKEYPPEIYPFIQWADANVKTFLWAEAHCYSETHWIGGISDCGFIDNDGKSAIIDFKSSKEAYITQFWQCAGYSLQIAENGTLDKDGNEIDAYHTKVDYFAILPFGAKNPVPAINVDVKGCQENFLHALALHNAMPKP